MARTKRTCSIQGCEKPAVKRGWCDMHYLRWYRNCDPLTVFRIKGDDAARIESYIDRSVRAPCWYWTGDATNKGYARIVIDGDPRLVHVLLWEQTNGPVPDGLRLDHLCHTSDCPGGPTDPHRRCVNPAHLTPTTNRENVLRGSGPTAVNARKTHCVHGHPFDETNTIITSTGHRRCRACKNRSEHDRWFRKKRARGNG